MSEHLEKLVLGGVIDTDMVMEFLVGCPPKKADSVLVERTAKLMRERLESQREKGFSGWNTPQCTNGDLLHRLKKNLEEGDLLDVINLAAMILAREAMFKEVYLD